MVLLKKAQDLDRSFRPDKVYRGYWRQVAEVPVQDETQMTKTSAPSLDKTSVTGESIEVTVLDEAQMTRTSAPGGSIESTEVPDQNKTSGLSGNVVSAEVPCQYKAQTTETSARVGSVESVEVPCQDKTQTTKTSATTGSVVSDEVPGKSIKSDEVAVQDKTLVFNTSVSGGNVKSDKIAVQDKASHDENSINNESTALDGVPIDDYAQTSVSGGSADFSTLQVVPPLAPIFAGVWKSGDTFLQLPDGICHSAYLTGGCRKGAMCKWAASHPPDVCSTGLCRGKFQNGYCGSLRKCPFLHRTVTIECRYEAKGPGQCTNPHCTWNHQYGWGPADIIEFQQTIYQQTVATGTINNPSLSHQYETSGASSSTTPPPPAPYYQVPAYTFSTGAAAPTESQAQPQPQYWMMQMAIDFPTGV